MAEGGSGGGGGDGVVAVEVTECSFYSPQLTTGAK